MRPSTRAEFSERLTQLFKSHFGDARVDQPKPVMAAEDFSRFWLADKTKQSVIFWVGGVPRTSGMRSTAIR